MCVLTAWQKREKYTRILVDKPERKRPLGTCKKKIFFKMDVKKTEREKIIIYVT